MSQIAEDVERTCLTEASEISHILHLLYKLDSLGNIPDSLISEFESATTFCQRALATPPIDDVIFEDKKYEERFREHFLNK